MPIALKEYFDYDDATRLIFRDDYRACDWDSIVYNELANRRPMYYSGSTSGGGHAFIVDGYDKDGLYHVNWGWGGSSNGYYLLSILDPDSNSGIGASSSTDGYSFGQDAVIGIQPNTGEPYHPEVKMTIESISTNQTTVTKTDGVFPITYTAEVRNYMENTHTFTLGVGVYNDNNELVYSQIQREIELKTRYGFSSMQHKCNIPTLPDGNYIIYPGDKLQAIGSDDQLTKFRNALEQEVLGEDYELEKREIKLRQFIIGKNSPFIGKTLENSGIRDKYDCMVVGMEEGKENLSPVSPTRPFEEGDIIWIVGEQESLDALILAKK